MILILRKQCRLDMEIHSYNSRRWRQEDYKFKTGPDKRMRRPCLKIKIKTTKVLRA
jgi:hypothetical protein